MSFLQFSTPFPPSRSTLEIQVCLHHYVALRLVLLGSILSHFPLPSRSAHADPGTTLNRHGLSSPSNAVRQSRRITTAAPVSAGIVCGGFLRYHRSPLHFHDLVRHLVYWQRVPPCPLSVSSPVTLKRREGRDSVCLRSPRASLGINDGCVSDTLSKLEFIP